MAPVLRDALRRVEVTLGVEPFSPEESARRFVIAANDHVTAVVVAPLSRELQKAAPGVGLVIRPSTRLDLAERIDLGRIDLAIGIFSQVPARLNTRTLMTQGEVILMRKGHPASRRKLLVKDLARYPLVTISSAARKKGRSMASSSSGGLRASPRCSTATRSKKRCAKPGGRRGCA
jgi:DNA-binding transcriptional LysR family regulator